MALGLWSQGSLEVRSKTWVLTARQPRNGQLYEYTLQQGYLQGRTVRVFIPPGYADSRQGFNAVYFHDGQMLFDSTTTWNHQSWKLTEATAFEGKYQDKVLIGIDNFPEKRYAEFFPSPIFNQLSPDLQTRLKDSLWGGEPLFDRYAQALIHDVFPLIESDWRVKKGGRHRTMVGSSMGAIVSLTFLLSYPKEIKGIIGLSLHLPLVNVWQFKDRLKPELSEAFNRFVSQNACLLKGKRIYIDRGDQSLDAAYSVYFPAFERALLACERRNMVTLAFIPGSGHTERDWSQRIGSILRRF